MAIARITGDPAWFASVAKHVEDHPRAQRELGRAATRPGRMAELTCEEVRVLAARLPDSERIAAALRAIEQSEARDRERSRNVRTMMDAHRT